MLLGVRVDAGDKPVNAQIEGAEGNRQIDLAGAGRLMAAFAFT